MKKHILSFFLAIIACAASAAQLNPFAYNLSSTYDAATMKLTVNWSTNAPSENIKIIVNDGTQDYIIKEYDKANYAEGYIPKNNYNSTIDVSGLPQNTELAWRIEVIGASQADNVVSLGNLIQVRMPMSIDIDNNPESPYFGRILVSQPTNNAGDNTQGVYMYTPALAGGSTLNGGTKCLPGIIPSTASWYNSLHMAPYRVRIAQDGTGTIFVSSCDVGREEYLWKVDPANPASTASWTRILTRDDMRTYANNLDPTTGDLLYNVGIDIREEGDNYKLALLSTSLGEEGFICGYLYSGEYTIAKTSTTGTYTLLTQRTSTSNPHEHVNSKMIGAALNGNILYDKNGNVWYTGATAADDYKEGAGLIHKNGDSFKADYGDVFQRQYMFAGGIRYNTDFSKIIIPQGNSGSYNAAIYDVNHEGTHPSLSNRVNLPRIASGFTKARTHIMDCAWDIAGNIYVCVGYVSTNYPWGVYSYATNLNGAAVSTPAVAQYAFKVACDGANHTVTAGSNDAILGSVSGGGSHESCSAVTVVATPTDKGRFIEWQNSSGESVSTDATYTFYMPNKDIELTAIFLPITYSGITWWNLLANGEEVEERPEEEDGYPGTNERIWRWMQVEYNAYLKEKNVTERTNWPDHTNSTTDDTYTKNKSQFNVAAFLNTEHNKTFFKESPIFSWLGKYIIDKSNQEDLTTQTAWNYFPYLFINRTDSAYNSAGDLCNYVFNGTNGGNNDITWDSFIEYGKMKHWRPYWTEYACGLPSTLKYNDPMPVNWTKNACSTGFITVGKDSQGNNIDCYPSGWMQWNNPPTDKPYLLAWRKGGTAVTNEIVHHVYEDDMALYATYVDKNLQEKDPAPSHQYDAKNDDILKLLANSNYGESTLHNITVDRKLQGGMYNTICLPFDVYILPTELEDADIKKFTGISETYDESGDPVVVLNFADAGTTDAGIYLEAGVPYLIQPTADVSTDLVFEGVEHIDVLEDAGPYAEDFTNSGGTKQVTFQGVFNPTTIPAGSLVLVADNRLAVTTEDGTINGYRAYFQIEDIDLQALAARGRVYLSIKKPVTTSVPLAPESEKQTAPEVRKVMYDGQIYILRGDEVYSITGQRVR